MNALRFDRRTREQASADDDLAHVADFDRRTQVTIDVNQAAILQ
jgi:hypothetical protein